MPKVLHATVDLTVGVDEIYSGLCAQECRFFLSLGNFPRLTRCSLFGEILLSNGDLTSRDIVRCESCLHVFGGVGTQPKP